MFLLNFFNVLWCQYSQKVAESLWCETRMFVRRFSLSSLAVSLNIIPFLVSTRQSTGICLRKPVLTIIALCRYPTKAHGLVLTLSDGKTFSLDRQQSVASTVGPVFYQTNPYRTYNWLFLFWHEGRFFRRLASCLRKRAKSRNGHLKRTGRKQNKEKERATSYKT